MTKELKGEGGGSEKKQEQLKKSAAVINAWVFGRDVFTMLGIGKGASEKEIVQASRKLLSLVHPDVAPDDLKEKATKITQEINNAVDALKNKHSRVQEPRESGTGAQKEKGKDQQKAFTSWFYYAFEGTSASTEKATIWAMFQAGMSVQDVKGEMWKKVEEKIEEYRLDFDNIKKLGLKVACEKRVQKEYGEYLRSMMD